jgi:hypothetical protein
MKKLITQSIGTEKQLRSQRKIMKLIVHYFMQ